MKAYGMRRDPELEGPDKAEIQELALKSSTGCLKTKSGEYRGIIKNKDKKARTRRAMKKVARREGKIFDLN